MAQTRTEVRALRADEYPAWNALVAASPTGSIYSTPEYLEVLAAATGGQYTILGAFRGEELAGGIGVYEERHPLGPIISNRLLLYYNGVVVREPASSFPSVRTSRLLEVTGAIADALAARPAVRVVLHNRSTLHDVRAFLSRGWSARPSYTYVVPIHDLTAQWERVEKNFRRMVRRCRDEGITVTEDDDFASFHRLHRELTDRKGAPQYLPEVAFRQYFSTLRAKSLGTLYHARMSDGLVIASQLVLLGAHPVTHTVSAASDGRYLRLGASAFLRWEAFERLAARGYKANDLTDAALNPVTHFKSQFGGTLEATSVVSRADAWQYRLAQAPLPVLRGARATAERLLQRVRGKTEEDSPASSQDGADG